ncbi:MAG: adenylate/guanylate cyclase domain-containing protein [Gaiellaceae bacterium]
MTCAECGAENREGAKFCDACGAGLDAVPSREQRKTVTVLFCDVTGSTALGESVDPETLRGLLARYFERMKAIVESHGGTVEKFIGDAVMAVFGVPVLHEDDALRAVRAAVEMRDALPELGVQARIGVNTGEVVTGTTERLATGDAVNVAARLEQAAAPGEVLVGDETLKLVRAAVAVESVEPLELKGKRGHVNAWRLLALRDSALWHASSTFVGRDEEIDVLRDAQERSVRERQCVLFTLLGTAGVGKSRLLDEFLGAIDGARAVRGRCLSYGEGITYYPVVEVLKQLLGAEPDTTLGELVADDAAADALRQILAGGGTATPQETAWAFRKLLETVARQQPLVVVFDDIHWGEPTFLDLIEHVADLSRDAPILLLCVARPELLERRPGWAGGKLNATTTLLEPLAADETDALLDALGAVDTELRDRIRAAADGNPLFVEEMVAMVRESGGRDVVVPPTIHALLAARLDQLPNEERLVLERGSVEGKEFHRGGVLALAADPEVDSHLTTLVRKDLIRPDRATVAGEDAYRFRHLLIRDAAYESLPKAARAELHELFAAWLDERGADLVERDEIVGYHLEQAARYKAELGLQDTVLAARASERLGESGLRALGRQDARAAKSLLARAVALLPEDDPRRLALAIKLAIAFHESTEFIEAERLLEATVRIAGEAGNEHLRLLAELELLSARASRIHESAIRTALSETAAKAIPVFEALGDESALACAWQYLSDGYWASCRWSERREALERALTHARRAGDARAEMEIVFHIAVSLINGPAHVDEIERWSDAIFRLAEENSGLLLSARATRTFVLTMRGEFEEARRLADANIASARELGMTYRALSGTAAKGRIELAAGNVEGAAEFLRESCEGLEAAGERNVLSTFSGQYALMLGMLGRTDEAEARAATARELSASDDVASEVLWRLAQARVCAHRGQVAEGVALVDEVSALLRESDHTEMFALAATARATLFEAEGRQAEAKAALEEAARFYELKGLLPYAQQLRSAATAAQTR